MELKRMKNLMTGLTLSILISIPSYSAIASTANTKPQVAPYTSTNEMLSKMTPAQALQRLKDGNMRFMKNKIINRNLLQQAKATSLHGQFPFAVVLSCMDSRGSSELILDQGLGDIFSIRVAGNIVDTDQLGSMEYATKVIGSKIIVVMGHTQCGAMGGACKNVELGNLTALLEKVQPAVKKVKDAADGNINCDDQKTIDAIAKQNVLDMMEQVKEKSSIIRDQISNKQILIIGAMHNLYSGQVIFFDEKGVEI